MTNKNKRFIVTKASGSQFAYVKDTESGKTIKRYNIFKKDAWNHADKHAELLNRESACLSSQPDSQEKADADQA